MNSLLVSNPSVPDNISVNLSTLYADLELRDITRARTKFEAFVHKVGYTNCGKSFKSDTYVEPTNGKIVATYVMTQALAAAFAVYCDPAKGFALVTKVMAQPADAIHHDLMFKISIPERWVVEVIGRKAASVHRSLSTATSRAKGGELEKHWEYRNGERWYTPWFLANAPFAKEDGMTFKNALTGLAVTLGLEGDVKKFLLAP